MEFYNIAYSFLALSGVKVSKKYLRERLESHSQYPSLISLTDILDEFQVENYPLRIKEKEKWRELDFPFLAHIISKNGLTDFELVKGDKNNYFSDNFLNRWTGIALILGKKIIIKHREHNVQFSKEKKVKIINWTVLSFLFVILIIFQFFSKDSILIGHFILSVVALYLSSLIITITMGSNNNITELFCKIQESGCNKVLNSKLGKFGEYISLGDLSVVYFSGSILYLTLTIPYGSFPRFAPLLFLNCLAVLLTPISIIYQYRLKSWCKLCILLVTVIWAQTGSLIWLAIVSGYTLESLFNISPINYYILILSISIASIWMVVKQIKLNENLILYQKIQLRKWRQNPYWFHALLPLHKKIDDSIWTNEIYLGNLLGELQIILVISPYCIFCESAYSDLVSIVEKHPESIGIRFRFISKSLSDTDKNYKAVFDIFRVYNEAVWKNGLGSERMLIKSIINEWFQNKNLSSWNLIANNTENKRVKILIEESANWASQMNIDRTPAFFINGNEMPNPHNLSDLSQFVTELIEIIKNEKP